MLMRWMAIALLASLLLSSCQLQRDLSPDYEAAYTRVAETLYADMTKNAPLLTQGLLTGRATDTPAPPVIVATNTPRLPGLTPVPAATFTPTPTQIQPTPVPRLVFKDNFKDQAGWADQSGDSFGFGFYQGGYRIYANQLNAAIWSIKEVSLGDVFVDVDVSQLAGPTDGYAGAVCRFQSGNNYYALVVSANRSVGIAKMKAGKFEFLDEAQAQPGAIQAGNGVNHIHAECVGSTLILYANGQKLLEVQDSDFSTGSTGMAAGNRKTPGMVALFTNIAVSQP